MFGCWAGLVSLDARWATLCPASLLLNVAVPHSFLLGEGFPACARKDLVCLGCLFFLVLVSGKLLPPPVSREVASSSVPGRSRQSLRVLPACPVKEARGYSGRFLTGNSLSFVGWTVQVASLSQ